MNYTPVFDQRTEYSRFIEEDSVYSTVCVGVNSRPDTSTFIYLCSRSQLSEKYDFLY
jgi:hypothetical protein